MLLLDFYWIFQKVQGKTREKVKRLEGSNEEFVWFFICCVTLSILWTLMYFMYHVLYNLVSFGTWLSLSFRHLCMDSVPINSLYDIILSIYCMWMLHKVCFNNKWLSVNFLVELIGYGRAQRIIKFIPSIIDFVPILPTYLTRRSISIWDATFDMTPATK